MPSAEWEVILHDDFEPEFDALPRSVRNRLAAVTNLLAMKGPQLSRPHADTLKGSKYPNMKELRFDAADGVWRVAFTFDPQRQAILLVAGDKSGQSEMKFYRQLIKKADERYNSYLQSLANNNEEP